MTSDSKEKEKIDSASYLSLKDDEIEEPIRKFEWPQIKYPYIRPNSERGFIDYIAIGAISALLAAKKFPGSFMSVMTQREAKLILNLHENANAKQIRQAHIKLMLLNHPDSGGSTYLASKINEAKDLLSSEVEDEKKDATDMQEDDDSSLNDILQDIPGEKESERLLLSIIYGHKVYYKRKEIKDIKKKLDEILTREKAEEKANAKNSHYESKEFKSEDSPLNEEPGKFVDKNSEFYQKYKDKIENGDYLDPYDDINTKRSRLTNKNDAFKI